MSNQPAQIPPELAAHFQREADALFEKNPEWKADPQKAVAELQQLRKDLVEHYGYSEGDVQVIPNHRNILVARDALAFRKHQAEAAKQREADARKKTGQEALQRKRQDSSKLKDRLAKARGNVGARAEIIADHLDNE
jgi:hypothetical protein